MRPRSGQLPCGRRPFLPGKERPRRGGILPGAVARPGGGAPTKLLVVIVDDSDSRPLMDALNRAHIGVTRLASTGGFVLEGNTTLLVGVPDEQVDYVLNVVRSTCMRRQRLIPQPVAEIPGGAPVPIEVEVGGATVWVLSVERMERI